MNSININVDNLYQNWTINLFKVDAKEVKLKGRNFINLSENSCSFDIEPLDFEDDFATWRMQAPKHFTLNEHDNRQQTFEIVSLENDKMVLESDNGSIYMELSIQY